MDLPLWLRQDSNLQPKSLKVQQSFACSENIYIFAGVTGFERKYAEPRIAPEYSKVGEQISLYNVPYIDIEDISAE